MKNSLMLSEELDCQHRGLLRVIRRELIRGNISALETFYINSRNKKYPLFEMNDKDYSYLLRSYKKHSMKKIKFVYLMETDNFCKIGVTGDISRRYNELSPHSCERIKAVYLSEKTEDFLKIESMVLDAFREKISNSEWMKISASEVLAVLPKMEPVKQELLTA